jgi:hypothetical protein
MVIPTKSRYLGPDNGIFLRFFSFREAIFGEKGTNFTFFSQNPCKLIPPERYLN